MRVAPNSRASIFLAFCLLASSRNAGDQSVQDSDVVRYQYHTHREIVKDDYSPTGEWEIHHHFPIFESDQDASQVKVINNAIAAKIEEYSCAETGEETFRARVANVKDGEIRIEYEAMWMCSSMPSPEHTAGTLELKLPENARFAGEIQPE